MTAIWTARVTVPFLALVSVLAASVHAQQGTAEKAVGPAVGHAALPPHPSRFNRDTLSPGGGAGRDPKGPALSGTTRVVPSRVSSADSDAWRESISEHLDQSIAELRTNAGGEKTLALVVTWGKGTEVRLPPTQAQSLMPSENELRFATIAGILREKGLPASLVSVAEVESGFNPMALSPKGARGLWQLMPETARRYRLIVEPHLDERIDPVKSTFAAAAYMKDLYTRFQDWPLALAAYNAGQDRVEQALRRVGAQNFWTLQQQAALPDETLRYVPAVLARLRMPLSSSALASTSLAAPPPTSRLAKDPVPQGRIVYAGTATSFPVPAGSGQF
jgi:hypothetical protein